MEMSFYFYSSILNASQLINGSTPPNAMQAGNLVGSWAFVHGYIYYLIHQKYVITRLQCIYLFYHHY